MDKFLFISRHEPSADQIRLAAEQGIELVFAGDLDAFAPNLGHMIAELDAKLIPGMEFAAGVVAVHPLICIKAAQMSMKVGSFRNINRAPVGEKPMFETDLFVVVEV